MDFGRYTQHLLAAAFILAAIAATGIFRYMEGPPRGVHQWRQTDCASIALNYFQDSPGFFHPQEHNLTGENGATVSEFPVLYYLDAQLYRLFGAHELIMRLVNLLFLVAGLGYLYRLGMLLHGSFLLAMIPVLLLISSPVWVYYGVHFLPNVPAISCCIAGWFYFFQWRETPSKKWLITWLVLFLSGALLKTSDGMSLLTAGIILLLQERKEAWWKRGWFAGGLVTLMLLGIWIMFAAWYNRIHQNELSLIGILPFWQYDGDYFQSIAARFYRDWSLHLFHPAVWVILGLMCLQVFMFFKRLPVLLRQVIRWTGIGSVVYLLLWTEPLYHHDYYMLTPFIFLIFLVIGSMYLLRRRTAVVSNAIGGILTAGSLAVILLYQPGMQELRNQGVQYENVASGFYTIGPWLESMGVPPDARVISVGDQTRNISLYLMNRRGWTDVYNRRKITYQQKVDEGARYVVVSGEPTKQSEDTPVDSLTFLGEYEGIRLYEIPGSVN